MKKIFFSIFISVGILFGLFVFNNISDVEAKEDIIKKSKEVVENIKITEKEEIIKIKVDIKGEVINPGVYELNENSRVIDVINLAGGLNDQADTDMINLSKKIVDEDVIVIYKLEAKATTIETYQKKINNCIDDYNDACITNKIASDKENKDSSDNNNATVTLQDENGLININTADINELTKLTGIGESKAKKIIEYRNEAGDFNTIEDIKNVSGIGDNIFDKIKENITV